YRAVGCVQLVAHSFPSRRSSALSGVTDTYSGHVSDSSAGSTASTTCVCDNSTTLTGTPIPTCTITPPASLCPGSTRDITVTGSDVTGPHVITPNTSGSRVPGST